MFSELMAAFRDESLTPLPRQVFPLAEVTSAFRYMAQARHIGKVVVAQPEVQKAGPRRDTVRADGAYLITGGLGGLGLRIARWLVDHGARHLVLLGRSEASETAQRTVAELEQNGAQVLVVQGDVSRQSDVVQVLALIAQSLPPLRGIIHAAGVLDDGILLQQDWRRFETVMAPKIKGAWYLHVLTQDLPIDFFVLFSSMASLLGSPGQGNYAAANAFLDTLAHYRRAQDLPALSINWGPWAETGMAQTLDHRERQRWSDLGVGTIEPEQGLEALGQLLRQEVAQVGVLPITWATFIQQFAPGGTMPFLDELAHRVESYDQTKRPSEQRPTLLQQLEKEPAAERYQYLKQYIYEQVAKVLGVDTTRNLEPSKPLNEMGLDSLMAVEFTNAVGNALGRHLPPTLVFNYPTIDAIATYLCADVLDIKTTTIDNDSHKENDNQDILNNVENLSDEEVEKLFNERVLKNRDA
jgi:myxalamid-type polyketide synthase MxaB